MNALDHKLLTSILADLDYFRGIDPLNIDRRNQTTFFIQVEDAHKYRLIPLAVGRWVGDYSPAGMKAGQRAIARLEAARQLKRDARWGGRTTHIELTKEGERIARELLKAKKMTIERSAKI